MRHVNEKWETTNDVYKLTIDLEQEKALELRTKQNKTNTNKQIKKRINNKKKKIKILGEKETYKCLGLLEANSIKQVEMKEQIKKEYRRRRENYSKSNCCRKLIKRINAWAVPLVRYSGPLLEWTREKLKQIDQRTRKIMTMHKALHPRDDVDKLYMSRKEGERGLANIQDSVDALIQKLEDYIKKRSGRLVIATKNNTDNTRINRTKITRKQNGKINNCTNISGDKRNLTRGKLDMAMKGKPRERK